MLPGDDLLWQALAWAHWPLVVVDEARTLVFANPEGRHWLRASGSEADLNLGDILATPFPPDAEELALDAATGLTLVQRKRGMGTPVPSGLLLDADGLVFRLERALDTALRIGQLVTVSEFTLSLYHDIESLYGRRESHALLDQIRTRVASQLRRGEFSAHLGNGRLVIVSIANPTREAAFQSTSRWLERLGQPYRIGAGEHSHSVSAGVAIAPFHGTTADMILDHAAAAAFSAEKSGRGTLLAFSEAMARQMQDDMAMESALVRALARDEFRLVFQPKVSWQRGEARLIGCEALLRWDSAELGAVPPSRFIPIAERAGLMPDLGHLVLEKACRHILEWRAAGWAPPVVAVNVSNHEFNRGDFRIQFEKTLKRHRIEPAAFQIEITESALLKDVEHGVHVLKSLKAEGVGLAIDDFGTGYSSLAYLRRFPADLLKIDRSFVVDAEKDPAARQVLGGIIGLAGSLGMAVLAEGIETPEQRDLLLDLGCNTFQGYYFGPPVPADALAARWRPQDTGALARTA